MIKQSNNSSILNNWTSAREKFTKGKTYDLCVCVCVREGLTGRCSFSRLCVCVLHTFALSIMLIWIVWSENCSHFAIHHGIIETIFSHSQSMFWIFVCLFTFFPFPPSSSSPSSLEILFSLRPEYWNLHTEAHQRTGTERTRWCWSCSRRRKEYIVWKNSRIHF